LAEITYRKDNV